MKIVADENIPLVKQAFGSFGEVETMPGRKIGPEAVRDAEALLVRSITRVDAALLSGSRVRFVGTATIGVDHVDRDWLKREGIGFASAPGSNAESVAEYVVAALLVLAERMNTSPAGKSLGVIGVGNVGSRVARNARALGMRVLLNDPPLKRATGDARYLTLEETLQADIVSLHVPLTREGLDRTWHLADEDFFRRMRPGSVFINTSRGAVAVCEGWMKALGKTLSAAVLDVWEHEPGIDFAPVGTSANRNAAYRGLFLRRQSDRD
jgi:erythronate-4-phosphate dehydrogenase